MSNYTPWFAPPTSLPAKKYKVSVLDLTNRVGGLDILFESLKHQSFTDFELVLVDALYNYRKDIVAEMAKQYNFPIKHILPSNDTFPVSNYNNSMNTGLVAAEGEILYFTCDYAVIPKDALSLHYNFHRQTPQNYVLMCPCNDAPLNLDAVSDNFPKHRQYGHRGNPKETQLLTVPEENYVNKHNEWSDRYKLDLDNGFLDKVLWSIFKDPFIYEKGMDNLIQNINLDTKFNNCSSTDPTPAFHDLCCVKADSFKLDFLIEANGFDEDMDGTWGFFDTELARRLLRCHGGQFFAMNTMAETVINTRYYLEPRKIVNGYRNINIIDSKYMREQPLTTGTVAEWKKNK